MKSQRFYSCKSSITEFSFLYFVLSVFKEIFLKLKVNKAFLLCFYSFIVLAFKFRYDLFQLKFWIHYEVRFIVYFFMYCYQIIPSSLLKKLLFLIELPWHLRQKIHWPCNCGSSKLHSIALIFFFLLKSTPTQWHLNYQSYNIKLRTREHVTSNFNFLI